MSTKVSTYCIIKLAPLAVCLPRSAPPQDGLAERVKRNADGSVKTVVRTAPFIQARPGRGRGAFFLLTLVG